MGFKHGDDDDDHVLWCELRHAHNSRGHDGFHRGRRAYQHSCFRVLGSFVFAFRFVPSLIDFRLSLDVCFRRAYT
eukprot:COSAG05_NODE_615_length_8327_cov_6.112543_3_plen_75_part_00